MHICRNKSENKPGRVGAPFARQATRRRIAGAKVEKVRMVRVLLGWWSLLLDLARFIGSKPIICCCNHLSMTPFSMLFDTAMVAVSSTLEVQYVGVPPQLRTYDRSCRRSFPAISNLEALHPCIALDVLIPSVLMRVPVSGTSPSISFVKIGR
jgi:hypothetical protein